MRAFGVVVVAVVALRDRERFDAFGVEGAERVGPEPERGRRWGRGDLRDAGRSEGHIGIEELPRAVPVPVCDAHVGSGYVFCESRRCVRKGGGG